MIVEMAMILKFETMIIKLETMNVWKIEELIGETVTRRSSLH